MVGEGRLDRAAAGTLQATGAPERRPDVGELIIELYETAAVVRARAEAVARAAGQSQARWQVLFTLAEGPLAVPLLARRLGITRQSVQRVVDLLAEEHLVETLANPSHQRSPLFALSEGGIRTLGRVNAAGAGWHATVRAVLGPGERQELRRSLAVLREAAGRRDGAATAAGHADLGPEGSRREEQRR